MKRSLVLLSVFSVSTGAAGPLHTSSSNNSGIAADSTSTLKVCTVDNQRLTSQKFWTDYQKSVTQQWLQMKDPNGADLQKKLQPVIAYLKDHDPKSCLAGSGLSAADVCTWVGAGKAQYVKADAKHPGSPILQNAHLVYPSSYPGLDYMKVLKADGQNFTADWLLVDRETQKVVGNFSDKTLQLDKVKLQTDREDYRGYVIEDQNININSTSFAYSNFNMSAPMSGQKMADCWNPAVTLDVAIKHIGKKNDLVARWSLHEATMRDEHIQTSMDAAHDAGVKLGAINVAESAKGVWDGVVFLKEYGMNTQVADPFHPGQKIGFRTLMNQIFGDQYGKALEDCVGQYCAGFQCSNFTALAAQGCVAKKAATFMGTEFADYVKSCFTAKGDPAKGIPPGAAAVSACLGDVAILAASLVPTAAVAKGASVAGQAGYRSLLEAVRTLPAAQRTFIAQFAKTAIRATAATAIMGTDALVNQMPTNVHDLEALQKQFVKLVEQSKDVPRKVRAQGAQVLAKISEKLGDHTQAMRSRILGSFLGADALGEDALAKVRAILAQSPNDEIAAIDEEVKKSGFAVFCK